MLVDLHQWYQPWDYSKQPPPCAYVYRCGQGSWASLLSVNWGQDCTFCRQGTPPTLPRTRRAQYGRSLCPRSFNQSTWRCTAWASSFYQRFGKCRDDANGLCYRVWYGLTSSIACNAWNQENIRSLHCWSDKWNVRLRRSCWTRDHSGYQCGSENPR